MRGIDSIFTICFLFFSFFSLGQCDSLLLNQQVPEGFKLSEQSNVSLILSKDDYELCVVLSGEQQVEFQVIGHRNFEVYFKTGLSFDTEEGDKSQKRIILTNSDEEDGVFRIEPDHSQRIYVRLFGVLDEEGKECVGVVVLEKN